MILFFDAHSKLLLIILPNEPDFATEMITTPNIYSGGPTFLTWTGLFPKFRVESTFFAQAEPGCETRTFYLQCLPLKTHTLIDCALSLELHFQSC